MQLILTLSRSIFSLAPGARKVAAIALCLLSTAAPINASTFKSGIFTFKIENGTACIIGCDEELAVKKLVIPATVNYNGTDYPVVEIDNCAFSHRGITSVSIPEGVAKIGELAFSDNKLTDVVLPQSLTSIYWNTFMDNDLKSINLPPLVELTENESGSIGCFFNWAGGEDGKIENIVIEASDKPLTGDLGVLCGNLTLRRTWTGTWEVLPSIGGGVTDVLTIEGDNVTFDAKCFIRAIYMPRIINIRGGNIELTGSIIDSHLGFNLINPEYLNVAIQETSKIKEINIECDNLKCGLRAFSNMKAVTEFKPSVTGRLELGAGLFYNCDALTSVELPPVEGLRTAVFQNCRNLCSFTVPGECGYINTTAFLGCDNLSKIVLSPGDAPLIVGCGTFEQMPLKELTLGREVTSGDMPFYGLKSLEKLTIADNITELPDYAFADCTGLKEIYCESTTPPVIHQHTFRGVSRTECKVFVRSNEDGYAQTDGWDEFFSSVKAVPDSADVTKVFSQNGNLCVNVNATTAVSIYSTQGVEIMPRRDVIGEISVALPAGTYIVVTGNKAMKFNHTNH